MAKFCTGCGKELSDATAFCTGCGMKVPEAAPIAPPEAVSEPVAPPPQPIPQPPQTPPAPPPQPPVPPAPQAESNAVSTAHFFWMMLVYGLPLVGWLICIIMAFAPKNESKKHFARAILIWGIVGIVLSIISLIIISLLGGGIQAIFSEINY